MAGKGQSGKAGGKARSAAAPRGTARRKARAPLPDAAPPAAPAEVRQPLLPVLPADVTREAFSAPALPPAPVVSIHSRASELLGEALLRDRAAMPEETGDAADILLARHSAMMQAIWTVWIGFVVIACSGYILAEWLGSLGVQLELHKAVLLWLPVAIIAGTGPVWLPLAVWSERRDLRLRLAMVAGEQGP